MQMPASGGQTVGPVTGSGTGHLEAEPCLRYFLPSPQTQHDRGLGGGRLNSVILSSKNPTLWMMASYNGLQAEAGPGLLGHEAVMETSEQETVGSALEEQE